MTTILFLPFVILSILKYAINQNNQNSFSSRKYMYKSEKLAQNIRQMIENDVWKNCVQQNNYTVIDVRKTSSGVTLLQFCDRILLAFLYRLNLYSIITCIILVYLIQQSIQFYRVTHTNSSAMHRYYFIFKRYLYTQFFFNTL